MVSPKERKSLVDTEHIFSLNKQCKLLNISKSLLYYQPIKPFSREGDLNLLDAINNIYSDFPSYGYRRIHKQLQRNGCNIGKKFIKKAMHPKGISSLSLTASTDITYIKLEKGFVYLTAIIDWHSKKILSWKLWLIQVS